MNQQEEVGKGKTTGYIDNITKDLKNQAEELKLDASGEGEAGHILEHGRDMRQFVPDGKLSRRG